MTFTKKKLPKSQIKLEVQLAPDELEDKKQKAIEALAKDVRLEGFRPGHIPLEIAEKHLNETAILGEAARLAIEEAYRTIVEQEHLDAIGEPHVQVLKLAQGNPLEFRIQVALLPDIELADYKKVALDTKKKTMAVEEKEVEDALTWLQESRKTKDGVTLQATNEFAQGIGNFTDLASLRQSIKEGLEHEKEMQEKNRVRQEIVEKIAEQSTFEIPDILVEREKQVLLSQIKQGTETVMRITFEEYLQKVKKTEQELLDSFGNEAEQRVKRFLVVREVAEKEGISPTQEEIEQEASNVLNVLKHYGGAQKIQKKIDLANLKAYTEGVLRHEKTLQFLESLCKA